MSELKPPKRACVLTLEMEADTHQEMVSALRNFMIQLDRKELGGSGVSGGYSSSHIYSLTVADQPTHDEFFEQLNAYLEASKKHEEPSP